MERTAPRCAPVSLRRRSGTLRCELSLEFLETGVVRLRSLASGALSDDLEDDCQPTAFGDSASGKRAGNAGEERAAFAPIPSVETVHTNLSFEGRAGGFLRVLASLALRSEDRVDDGCRASVVALGIPVVAGEPLAVALVLGQKVIHGASGVLPALEHGEVRLGDALGLSGATGLGLLPRNAVNVVEVEVDHAIEPSGWVVLGEIFASGLESLLLVRGQVADIHARVVTLRLGAKLGLGVAGAGAERTKRVEPSFFASGDAEMGDADKVAAGIREDNRVHGIDGLMAGHRALPNK